MKENSYRHIHFDFENSESIAIRTNDPVEKVIREVQTPHHWKNGIVPVISRVTEEWW